MTAFALCLADVNYICRPEIVEKSVLYTGGDPIDMLDVLVHAIPYGSNH